MAPSLLTLPFSKKEKWCQVTEICRTLLMAFVVYGYGGKFKGVGMG